MPATEAQIAASRLNGSKSRGPRTAEGKATSRRNSLKHGMAGEGVVVPEGDAAEVERRAGVMLDEIRPATEMGRFLVRRLAALSVRVERCAEAEFAAVDHRAAHAEAAFDEARLAEVDDALGRIDGGPAASVRKLRSMPEGVDRMVDRLLGLRRALDEGRWDRASGEALCHLAGERWHEAPGSRARALSEAVEGVGPGSDDPDRAARARSALGEHIDFEVALLREHRESLDLGAIEADRLGAAARSGFDPSREATLARRYEAAAERGLFRSLGELRRVEAESVPAGDPEESEGPEPGPSGSSGAGAERDPSPSRSPGAPAPAAARSPLRPAVDRPVGAPGSSGTARPGPA